MSDFENILTNDGFDLAVGEASKPLQALLSGKRGKGLDLIQTALQGANLSNLAYDALEGLGLDLQVPLLVDAQDAPKIASSVTASMGGMLVAARAQAVEAWGIELETPVLPDDDERIEAITSNTAGLFAMERDRALAARVAERFAKGVIANREKKKASKDPFDPFTFFAMPWGDKAEKQYWMLVSSAWLGKARNYSIAATFADAGYEYCRIAAEIDERTTHTCRFLHMKRVLVSSVQATDANLVAPQSTGNWIAETPPPPVGGLTADTQAPLLLLPPLEPGGKPRPLAQRTEEHIVGTGNFDMGKYNQFVSDEELAKTLGPPPYHFLCRSLLVPDDFVDPLGLQADIDETPVPSGIDDFIDATL